MTHLLQLIKWDAILLHRNKLFILAGAIAIMYTGLFYLIKPLGNLSTLLIVLIFNDPVVTGYLFAAVLLLFDRQQHTLEAVSVLPIPFSTYLLSKTILLSVLATVVALIMTLASATDSVQMVHLCAATFFSAIVFSLMGFTVCSLVRNFNQLLIYSVPFFILSGVPLLQLFGYGRIEYYLLLPSTGGIGILQAACGSQSAPNVLFMYAHLFAWTGLSWYLAVKVTTRRMA